MTLIPVSPYSSGTGVDEITHILQVYRTHFLIGRGPWSESIRGVLVAVDEACLHGLQATGVPFLISMGDFRSDPSPM